MLVGVRMGSFRACERCCFRSGGLLCAGTSDGLIHQGRNLNLYGPWLILSIIDGSMFLSKIDALGKKAVLHVHNWSEQLLRSKF